MGEAVKTAGDSKQGPTKATSSHTSKAAPECPHCGAPREYVQAWHGPGQMFIPSYHKKTCGSAACVAASFPARTEAVRAPTPEETSARVERELCERMVRAGVPESLVHHTHRDFPDIDIPVARNVFVYGPNGVGKSALAAALFRLWGCNEWVSAYRILSRIKSTFKRKGGDTEEDVIDALVARERMVIDDLGAESRSEFGLATLYEVIKERCEANRVTIVTSNRALSEIDKDEPRLASRLGAFHVVAMKGGDRRLAQPARERKDLA